MGKSVGLGAAGAAAAAAALLGPKALTSTKAGKGHPLKHRVLDLASGALQRKYPVEAISTYLNGFHMYADDMGRQMEASHFCIHLRHDLHQCPWPCPLAGITRRRRLYWRPVDVGQRGQDIEAGGADDRLPGQRRTPPRAGGVPVAGLPGQERARRTGR